MSRAHDILRYLILNLLNSIHTLEPLVTTLAQKLESDHAKITLERLIKEAPINFKSFAPLTNILVEALQVSDVPQIVVGIFNKKFEDLTRFHPLLNALFEKVQDPSHARDLMECIIFKGAQKQRKQLAPFLERLLEKLTSATAT